MTCTDLASRMLTIAAALPKGAVRDVCLTLLETGQWECEAGGHPSVHIGEAGGDIAERGATADEAISKVEAKLSGSAQQKEIADLRSALRDLLQAAFPGHGGGPETDSHLNRKFDEAQSRAKTLLGIIL